MHLTKFASRLLLSKMLVLVSKPIYYDLLMQNFYFYTWIQANRKFEWRPDATHIIFHVLDAPGHGKEFHPSGKDWDAVSTVPEGRENPAVEVKVALEHLMLTAKLHR